MRNYTEAKTMARSLRTALAAQTITVSHAQSLELIAQAFGLADWNTLAARIKTDEAPADGEAPPLGCSFCGKTRHEVQILVAGPDVHICDECVSLCDGVLLDHRLAKSIAEAQSGAAAGEAAEEAAAVLRARSDEALRAMRRGETSLLEHVNWSLIHLRSRVAGGEVQPWAPDAHAVQRGWTRDPHAGKSAAALQAEAARLETLSGEIVQRLALIQRVLAERGVSAPI